MNPVALLFVSFFGLVVIRVPVAYALALSSLVVAGVEGLRPTLSCSRCSTA